jgi:hypothetical protein
MPKTSDQMLYEVLVTLVTLLAVGGALFWLVRVLCRSRAGLAIGIPVAVAFGLRVIAAAGVSLTSVGDTLRGSDEAGYIAAAHTIADSPFGSADWTNALTDTFHLFLFSVQVWAFDSPEFALRITQAGIAVAGITLLAIAVYELVGPRPALIAAWLLALEPTSIFFSSILHKEPNMLLAAGLVLYGGAIVWKRADPRYLAPIALGCLIAVTTRSYAGWFLIATGAAICLHAGLRSGTRGSMRSASLVAAVLLLIAIAAPTVIGATEPEELQQIQVSQTANTTQETGNLALEQVDFSTRSAIFNNLPRRMFDIAFRPYPWQLDSASQQVGLIGTAVAYAALACLLFILLQPGRRLAPSAPAIYTLGFLFVAYALSAGNAGTAFRYRTHLVTLLLVLLVVLWFSRDPREERMLSQVGDLSQPPPAARTPASQPL